MRTILLNISFLFISFLGSAQNYTLIQNVTVADVVNQKLLPAQDILIKDSLIFQIGKNLKPPANAKLIDGNGRYVVPGMIDAHVHFFQSGSLFTRPDAINLNTLKPYSEEIVWTKEHVYEQMLRYLACGVTGVVDCGGPFWNFDVRDLSRKSALAPHLAVAGPLISTYGPPNLDTLDPPIIKVTTPEAAAALVRKQIPYKPDFIKVWYIVLKGETPEQYLPIFRAVVAESKKNGFRVAVHATELEVARLVVKEGADILVHSVFDKEVDAAFIKLLQDRRTIYIPTIAVREGYAETFSNKTELTPLEYEWSDQEILKSLFEMRKVPDSLLSARFRQMLSDTSEPGPSPIAMKNLKILADAGVTIATGTDAGNIGTPHGPAVARELEIMHAAGLSNWQLLTYSTLNGAKVMGMNKTLSSIESGKSADFMLLNANPIENYQNLFDWDTLILKGQMVNRRNLIIQKPEDLVQQQVNAYNARDIDAFMNCFSADCKIYEFSTGELLMEGETAMRARYGKMFKELTTLHCTIENRITIGNKVIDREIVAGVKPYGELVHAVAIYEVQQGKIAKCWFLR